MFSKHLEQLDCGTEKPQQYWTSSSSGFVRVTAANVALHVKLESYSFACIALVLLDILASEEGV